MACMEKRKQKPLRKHKEITRHVQGPVDYRPRILALRHVTVQHFGAVLSSVSNGMKEDG